MIDILVEGQQATRGNEIAAVFGIRTVRADAER